MTGACPSPHRLSVPRVRHACRFRFVSVGALACALAAIPGCGPAAAPQADKAPPPTIEAAVLTVEPRPWPKIVRSQGSLIADEEVVVGSKVAGRVAEVHIDLGDPVRAGAPLATLERSEFLLQVRQAEAQLAQARAAVGLSDGQPVESLDPQSSPPVRQERALLEEALANLERGKRLRAQNVITQAELDQLQAAWRVAEARYASAVNAVEEKIALISVREAELGLARERYENAVIRAPFDGFIEQRDVAPGAYVQVGSPIATIVRSNTLRFRGAVPERHAQSIAIGQEVILRIESIPEPQTIRITRVSPALDLRTRALAFEAEIKNENQALRAGLFAEAEIVVNPDARAIVVPASAVVEFAGAEKVWKLTKERTAAEQAVQIGSRRGDSIEIIQGLSPGDVILQSGQEGKVAIIKPLAAPVQGRIADVTGVADDTGDGNGSE